MGSKIKIRNKSIAEQVGAMKTKYPQFTTTFTHQFMKVEGDLQPTARSLPYHFVLKYNLVDSPKTKIVSPALQKNGKDENIPHLYPGENLCLYHPNFCEFSRTDFLSDTIIPWTSLWLYYYEVWHITDEWLGGGEHPIKPKIINK
jgi:hypothetical protein